LIQSPSITREDLEQIRQLIREENGPLKSGQERLEKKIDEVEMKVETVNTTLQQSMTANADFFNHAGIFFDEMRNQIIKRIELIEEQVGLSHKN
jgi:tetrahydromethanopterin S-methyltransferase subunit G